MERGVVGGLLEIVHRLLVDELGQVQRALVEVSQSQVVVECQTLGVDFQRSLGC